ncbi:MAG: queuosine precursor transporter [Endozoicomonas sp.]
MQTTQEYPLPRMMIFSLFFAGMAIAAVLASKIILIAGYAVPAGVLAYAITFACTDIVGEAYGEKTARNMVLAGFVAMVVVTGLIHLAIAWPAAPFWDGQANYEQVLGSSSRIILASLVAYLCSQTLDIWIFSRLRKATNGKHLWLRNNLSTFSSQLIDSAIFVTVAFYGVFPISEMIIGQWIVKMIIAAIDTPLVYLGVSMLRPSEARQEMTAVA